MSDYAECNYSASPQLYRPLGVRMGLSLRFFASQGRRMRGIGGVSTPQYIRCTSEGLKYFTLAAWREKMVAVTAFGRIGGGTRVK